MTELLTATLDSEPRKTFYFEYRSFADFCSILINHKWTRCKSVQGIELSEDILEGSEMTLSSLEGREYFSQLSNLSVPKGPWSTQLMKQTGRSTP